MFVILLIASEPTVDEWNRIIATVQQHDLTWLYLGQNKIVVIPDSIAQLRNLKALSFWCTICVIAVIAVVRSQADNEIEKLPDWISNLANLQRINVGGLFHGIAHSAASSHRR